MIPSLHQSPWLVARFRSIYAVIGGGVLHIIPYYIPVDHIIPYYTIPYWCGKHEQHMIPSLHQSSWLVARFRIYIIPYYIPVYHIIPYYTIPYWCGTAYDTFTSPVSVARREIQKNLQDTLRERKNEYLHLNLLCCLLSVGYYRFVSVVSTIRFR